MKPKLILIFLIIACHFQVQAQYPPGVQMALKTAGANKAQLIKALDHFYKSGDSLKIKSVNFLITYMPVHSSHSYYWADGNGKHIPFNELNYSSFNEVVEAIDALKKKYNALHPVAYSYRDIDSINADYLIENIELACEKWKSREAASSGEDQAFTDFLEYTLPYRASIEPVQRWRATYLSRFNDVFGNKMAADSQVYQLKQAVNKTIKNTWGIEGKNEPLPRLGALQILLRGKGLCEDLADMAVFVARSQGIPAAVDNIPYWGTTSGNHFLNFLRITPSYTHFDAVLDSLEREPSKVLRSTYSPQKDAIANWLDTSLIPPGFMRIRNYKDVTQEYWPTDTIACALFKNNGIEKKVAYLAVFNGFNWQPAWYGKISNNKATFQNMSKGVAYLPMYYESNRLIPAGWPYALGYNNKMVLQPDTLHTRSITLREQEKYLKYRPGKRYRLFYWSNTWKLLGEQTAAEGTVQLTFGKVPANSLLIMIPEYSQGKERPFIITANGERVWW
jgi:hypothetical protein